MTEQATEYRVTYTKANLDALRAEDKAAIERLTKDLWAARSENQRAEQSLAKAQKRLELIGSVIDKDNLDRSSLHDAIDEILTCQKIPPQCQHCGGLTDWRGCDDEEE